MKSSCKLSLESNNKAYEMFSPSDECNASWEISQVTWQCNFNTGGEKAIMVIFQFQKMAFSSFDVHTYD